MKRFRFRLERVLQFRRRIKEDRLKELLEANTAVSALEDRREQLGEAQLANKLPEDSYDSLLLEMQNLYAERLRAEIEETVSALNEAKDRAKDALSNYLEASKEEKALLSLRQKRKSEHDTAVEKYEQAIMDEISVQRGNTLLHTEEGMR